MNRGECISACALDGRENLFGVVLMMSAVAEFLDALSERLLLTLTI